MRGHPAPSGNYVIALNYGFGDQSQGCNPLDCCPRIYQTTKVAHIPDS